MYIAGIRCPTPENLRRICAALGVSIAEGLRHTNTSSTGRPSNNKEQRLGAHHKNPERERSVGSMTKNRNEAVNLEQVHKQYDLPMNQYAALVEKAMLERGISIKDLATELLCSYEHIRQVIHGGRNVSPMMNRAICSYFGLDEEEMGKAAQRDRMIKQFGAVMQDTKKKDAILQAIENGWPLLTEKQKELIAENVSRFTFQNRAHGTFRRDS